jgi:hypothetical protein
VIDNRDHTLADILDDLLRGDTVHAMDVAATIGTIRIFRKTTC